MNQIADPTQRPAARAMTLIEMVVAVGLGTLVLAVVVVLFIFGLRSFAAMGNYAQLSGQSHLALDAMSREIRQATQITGSQTTASNAWLQILTVDGSTVKYAWDSNSRVLTREQGGVLQTNLTGCDVWNFSFYDRAPQTNWVFNVATNSGSAKLINMSFKCSRSVLGQKINTESVLSAQIVLRNKS